jgi:hypothetical protein
MKRIKTKKIHPSKVRQYFFKALQMSATMSATEYSESVRAWLMQAYQWQALAYCKYKVEICKIVFNSKLRLLASLT